jgi:E3 ubiquitin-protein ligase DRIP
MWGRAVISEGTMPYSGRNGVTYKEVRIAKAPLLTCLTCPLCNYLIREATTISECLHTFCKDCITAELSNGESECCPMCHVGLGTLPLEKLRVDHQLNDLKEKLFPTNAKKRKPGLSIDSPGTSNATKRKERSLYSLGVKGTQAVNPGYASRKTRALPGGSEPSSMDEELEDGGDDEEEGISDGSPSTVLKLESRAVSHNGGSRRSSAEEGPEAKVYPHSEPRRGRANVEEFASTPRRDGEQQLRASNSRPWTTSKLGHRLAQTVANGNKSSGSREGSKNGRGSRKNNGSSNAGRGGRGAEFPSALDALAQVANADAAMEETGSGPPSPSPALELFSLGGGGNSEPGQRDTKEGVLARGGWSQQDGGAAGANGQSLQSRLKQTLNGVMERPSILRNNGRALSLGGQASRGTPNGIWFHLESGDVQANEDALPALSSPYVRIKDGKLPVYQVKKYLVQKLAHKVKTEMEVEITCRGQPVVSSLPLESIRDIWFSAQISAQPQTQAQAQGQGQAQGEASAAPANGSSSSDFPSAKDFLMVLTYRRHRKPRINS